MREVHGRGYKHTSATMYKLDLRARTSHCTTHFDDIRLYRHIETCHARTYSKTHDMWANSTCGICVGACVQRKVRITLIAWGTRKRHAYCSKIVDRIFKYSVKFKNRVWHVRDIRKTACNCLLFSLRAVHVSVEVMHFTQQTQLNYAVITT
jgi:hypothetical protein